MSVTISMNYRLLTLKIFENHCIYMTTRIFLQQSNKHLELVTLNFVIKTLSKGLLSRVSKIKRIYDDIA